HQYMLFFNDPLTTETYDLSLHDALPISIDVVRDRHRGLRQVDARIRVPHEHEAIGVRIGQRPQQDLIQEAEDRRVCADSEREGRSEEHTSELQSRFDLVCRLLLEKKKAV